jgi:predicted metal-binding protein
MDTATSVGTGADGNRQTKRKSLMQVLVCMGCCCGRVDRGKPEVPVDWLKARWKEARLNPYIQLTISGCLGPCDLPNVVAILTETGQQWIGQLTQREHYEALVEWGRACGDARHVEPPPAVLRPYFFERF